MATKKISELPAAATLTGTETVPVVQAGATVKATVTAIAGIAAPDATTLVKGKVKLAGDLAGTADAPTVVGLSAKATDTAVVHNTGAETVAGVKTFSSAPVLPAAALPIAATSGLQAALDAKAADSAAVKLTGDQTVAGIKTFSSSPAVPDAAWAIAKTSGLQAALDAKVPVFNVKAAAYGAVGDGVADDIIAINNAIAAAVAAGGGIVFFPTGTYLVTSAVNLLGLVASPRSNVKLVGISATASLIRRRTAGIVIELAGYYNAVINLGIDGFAVATTASGTTTGASVDFTCAALTQSHVGVAVTGTGIAPNSFIRAVNGTTGTLTVAATATATNTLTFAMKGATTGIMVRGNSVGTPTYHSTRHLDLTNIYVQGCKEGVRFGHYSTLNGVTGDTGDADITANNYTNVWIDRCDYGWIEDGQNILLNKVTNLITTGITYNHTLQPRGGQVHIDTGALLFSLAAPATTIAVASNGAVLPQATINVASTANFPTVGTVKVTTASGVQQVVYTGVTATTFTGCSRGVGAMSTGGAVVSNGFPKCSAGSSNLILKDVRSENTTGTEPPVVLTAPGNAAAQVTQEHCVWTNGLGVTNIDDLLMGGGLVKINCITGGATYLNATDYVGLSNDIQGGYFRGTGQSAKNELIMDFDGAGTPVSQISAGLGKMRLGSSATSFAYSPVASLTVGEGVDPALAVVGPVAPSLGFHISQSAPQRSAIYMFGTGSAGGLLVLQTKPTAGALRDAMVVYDEIAATETAAALLCNDAGVFTMKRVTVGAVDSGGAGFRMLRVPNS